MKILIPLNYGKLNFYFQMFSAVAIGSLGKSVYEPSGPSGRRLSPVSVA